LLSEHFGAHETLMAGKQLMYIKRNFR